jgi:hypothetical protein
MCNITPSEKTKEEKKSNRQSEKEKEDEEKKRIQLIESVFINGIISIRRPFRIRRYKLNEIEFSSEQITKILSVIIEKSIGNNTYILNKNFATSIYRISKTFGKLPSEIMKLDSFDFNLNIIITNIGREDDYRCDLLSALKGYGIDIYGNQDIKSLERMLDNAKNNQRHR